jgi:hypothetical protein
VGLESGHPHDSTALAREVRERAGSMGSCRYAMWVDCRLAGITLKQLLTTETRNTRKVHEKRETLQQFSDALGGWGNLELFRAASVSSVVRSCLV